MVSRLLSRGLVRVRGADAPAFLQGLVTADLQFSATEAPAARWGAFLNRKGRVLFDAFFVHTGGDNSITLDVDASRTDQLVAHLGLYRMRSKVQFESLGSEWGVWAGKITDLRHVATRDGATVLPDPRSPDIARAWAPSCSAMSEIELPERTYQLQRLAKGLPEGQTNRCSDFAGTPTPLECNLELLNGVAFDKGCYIGQELTARTHHVGIVRKRLVPFEIPNATDDSIAVGDHVLGPKQEKVGLVTSWVAPLGMARLKLSTAFAQGGTTSDALTIRGNVAHARLPDWMPSP